MINDQRWDVNPLLIIPRQIFDVVDRWLEIRLLNEKVGSILPSAGGYMDQPAALMEAFGILDRALQKDAQEETP